ncbi:uncharacterized protein F4812DRAFT_428609 [Daldinia caldariorum]|uniref:uncharacterized protein n=1 Tax=Daldinia caldariorum TaxID=326644 RepID=UPI0020079A65|nr:uncharacterized protein F4812DRAFT_428609 [Daldinia caldariorum]KAI1468036.1 hypothetical protein F4812DRAFT_428609 [Daldinia caldariorum]
MALNNADDRSENLASISPAQVDEPSLLASTKRPDRPRIANYTRQSSRLPRHFRIKTNRKVSNSPRQLSDKENIHSQCVPFEQQRIGRYHESILQLLSEVAVNQDRLLALLQKKYDDNEESLKSPFPHVNANQPQPSPVKIKFNPSSLQKYIQNTLHPDSVRLCDMFLARYNLPHVLSGSYDPIELIHAHGWEQEGCGETTLVVQDTSREDAQAVEVPWRHIDQIREPQLALKLTRVASLIKSDWAYQGKSIRNLDEVGVPFETDEFADSGIFLNCPGFTKALLYQSGYDSYGAHFARAPWLSVKRSLLRQLQPDDDRLHVDRSCPWDGKVFGRVWQVFHARQLLSFACIYLALSQMSVVGDTGQDTLGTRKALRFLSRHTSDWPRFTQTSEVWLSSDWIHMHFHLRVLSAGKQYLPSTGRPPENGLRPSRVSGVLASLDGLDNIGIVEERFSLAIVTSHTTDMPPYTIFYLSDSEYRRLFMESERSLDMPNQGRFTGIAVFLRILLSIFPLWRRKWVETLNEIDKLVGVKIDELFDPGRDGATTMFDSTFDRSRLYFTVLQTLRIFSEWIQESGRELQQLQQDFDANFQFSIARRDSTGSRDTPISFIEKIDETWEKVIAIHSASSKSLMDRIEKKEEEIKGFRDGLFSATSVREASRATILNQYILVFTIVTIFYLPLSYVSSLFSMDIFAYDDVARGQSSFLISTSLLAVGTWAISGVVLWLVHDDKRLSNLKLSLGNFLRKTFHPRRRRIFDERKDSIFEGM